MNILDDRTIREQFNIDEQKKTIHCGKLLSIWGIPIISIICLVEWLTYQNYAFVFCRLLFIVPQILFLIFSYTAFKKSLKLVIPFHVITISCGLLMMTGLTILKFKFYNFAPAYWLSSVTGGFVVVIFITFLFASGARQYLKYMLPTPLVILILYTLNIQGLEWKEITFFINPILSVLGVIIFTQYQEKLIFNEYKQRMLAEAKENLLQHEIEERQKVENKLFEKTIKDELTGVYNRRMLFSFLKEQIGAAEAKNKIFTVCYIDLDNFKEFNDLYGHLEGDSVISNFILKLKNNIRETDIICRVGGDEFIVIFPNCNEAEAKKIIKRAKNEIISTLVTNEISISFSHGYSEYKPNSNLTANDLIEQADTAMYKMKKALKAV